jgi:hypothetical protein
MDEKLRLYSLTFLPFFAPFSKMKKVAKTGQKVKAIYIAFSYFFARFPKLKKAANS